MKIYRQLILLVMISVLSSSVHAVTSFAGTWTFTESWPDLSGTTNNYLNYELTIPSNSSQSATLDISGFQTYSHIDLTSTEKGDVITFSSNDQHKPLLKLIRSTNSIKTQWLNLKPALDVHKGIGVYFRRSK